MINWEERYQQNNTGWDIGYPSTPLKEYFDQIKNKDLKILIPGAGNAHEAEYLHQQGFTNVFILDIAPSPLIAFAKRNPSFPKSHLIEGDFFSHEGAYDLIVEQTFFCAISLELRAAYAKKVNQLLKPNGKLMGLFWSIELNTDQPPFGGCKTEYREYFDEYFDYVHFDQAYNSIKPRKDTELFLLAKKK
ncbi:MAG: methyltransferase domain-containing protein [Flavobacteriales bacterium]|nr:methyltransferase domain-containing protein [Flavobacteriales bacterium]